MGIQQSQKDEIEIDVNIDLEKEISTSSNQEQEKVDYHGNGNVLDGDVDDLLALPIFVSDMNITSSESYNSFFQTETRASDNFTKLLPPSSMPAFSQLSASSSSSVSTLPSLPVTYSSPFSQLGKEFHSFLPDSNSNSNGHSISNQDVDYGQSLFADPFSSSSCIDTSFVTNYIPNNRIYQPSSPVESLLGKPLPPPGFDIQK